MPALSVIIPTRDRPQWLVQAIDSITRGSLPADEYEIIIADNGEREGIAEIVTRWRNRFPQIHYVRVEQPGLHEARHAGMRSASGDLLVFCDDDIIAGETWLESIHEAFRDSNVWMVGGNDLPRFEAPPPRWLEVLWARRSRVGRSLDALSLIDFGLLERDIPPHYVFGCNFAIRRAVLHQAGGFHPDGLPPDRLRYRGDGETHVSEFVRRRGGRARYVPGASVHHLVTRDRMTQGYFETRYFAQGVSDSYSAIRAAQRIDPIRTRVHLTRLSVHWLQRALQTPSLAPRQWQWWRAYRQGFKFHQSEVARDSTLLAWVLKDTYL